jgi:hypothetical protein
MPEHRHALIGIEAARQRLNRDSCDAGDSSFSPKQNRHLLYLLHRCYGGRGQGADFLGASPLSPVPSFVRSARSSRSTTAAGRAYDPAGPVVMFRPNALGVQADKRRSALARQKPWAEHGGRHGRRKDAAAVSPAR